MNTETEQMNSSVLENNEVKSVLCREDIVTEYNQRDLFQSIAPLVQNGLYLVPKFID